MWDRCAARTLDDDANARRRRQRSTTTPTLDDDAVGLCIANGRFSVTLGV